GGLFAISLLLFAFTGGNMFQTWNVADTTREYFGVPTWVSGVVIATAAGIVIIGGIKRIGMVTKTLVPLKCGVYVLCGLVMIFLHRAEMPDIFRMIFHDAFAPASGVGAFTGAVFGTTFMFGMKRALFSSESGLGTAPIAHSAVKTPEPVTEGVVAGLEPFIDTIFVCTVTGLVILCAGIWNRGPSLTWETPPQIVEVSLGQWQPDLKQIPNDANADLQRPSVPVFVMVERDGNRARVYGTVQKASDGYQISWQPIASKTAPTFAEKGLFADYRGATLVAKSFDTVTPGLGRWLITIAVWVFALSTLISYGYYGEQGITYLLGAKYIAPYRWLWCIAAAAACFGFIKTSEELDAISTVGMGFMYWINLPLMLVMGSKAMSAYHDYFRRLHAGQIKRV
ncbi:MAG TPA: alanine:cation symporter family protein, partial [Nevskiaceae bacterium]|nr:alanine:cation symporter family protein [Nevskiaceae bacterium]